MGVKVETKLVQIIMYRILNVKLMFLLLFLDITECETTLTQATMPRFLVRWSCEFLDV